MANTRDTFDWNLFLRQFSRDLLDRLEDSEFTNLSSEIINNKWLGYPGAIHTEIPSVEARLETTLPPSYRNFLAASNGWQKLDNMIDRLLSTQEIDWLASRNQELIDGWMTGIEIGSGYTPVPDEEYFVYGDEQDSTLLRNEYLQTALEIGGDSNQGLLLLNPQIVSENGEWEAWFFANWLPGAHRYRSFYELMLDLHKRLLELPKLREIPNSDENTYKKLL
ncbi:SMI1/KNR4 family protein [Scytonema tolypothrichoides VB-61278]|nr:SMI1/KNR4 family protein [Scytonema tolypothrichoides VB-61278]